jgi:hypothetical protein
MMAFSAAEAGSRGISQHVSKIVFRIEFANPRETLPTFQRWCLKVILLTLPLSGIPEDEGGRFLPTHH